VCFGRKKSKSTEAIKERKIRGERNDGDGQTKRNTGYRKQRMKMRKEPLLMGFLH
jgi:hypothetical protein